MSYKIGLKVGLKTRRLLLGAFLLYLFGLLGYQGSSHRHETAASHPECQLCQVTAQAYAAPVPLDMPRPVAMALSLVEAAERPILAFRFQPFASRAPPSA